MGNCRNAGQAPSLVLNLAANGIRPLVHTGSRAERDQLKAQDSVRLGTAIQCFMALLSPDAWRRR